MSLTSESLHELRAAAPWLADAEPLSPRLGLRLARTDLGVWMQRPTFAGEFRAVLSRFGLVAMSVGPLSGAAMAAIADALGAPSPRQNNAAVIPEHPSISVIAGGVHSDDAAARAQVFHHDGMNADRPPTHVLLFVRSAPGAGTSSAWIDMRDAWAALPTSLQSEVADLRAWHNGRVDDVDVAAHAPERRLGADAARSGRLLPLVHTDTPDARPALLLPLHRDAAIEGRDDGASAALLADLWRHVQRGERIAAPLCSGELIVWDNLALLHDRDGWPAGAERESWITSVVATDRPVGGPSACPFSPGAFA